MEWVLRSPRKALRWRYSDTRERTPTGWPLDFYLLDKWHPTPVKAGDVAGTGSNLDRWVGLWGGSSWCVGG